MTLRNAAGQIWPHLQSDQRRVAPEQPRSLAAALYPSLTPQARAQDELRSRNRQSLLKGLRELNTRLKEG